MTNPDYTYSFREHKGRQVLVIEDTSPTGFFVEDNVQHVTNDIFEKEGGELKWHLLIWVSTRGLFAWRFPMNKIVKYEAAEWQTVAEYLLNEQM